MTGVIVQLGGDGLDIPEMIMEAPPEVGDEIKVGTESYLVRYVYRWPGQCSSSGKPRPPRVSVFLIGLPEAS
ncbi:hypothetical protein [Pseudomonas putida]|uniref:hypothetical protein n=1 Tax=Pseudomonas putida TaxID=303 RepID=UPI00300EA456